MATRACSWCEEQHTPRRWKIGHSFCSTACRKAASRAGRYPGEYEDRIVRYRPRSLALAQRALDAGVPLDHLILSADEHDVVIVACLHGGSVLQAAQRLMTGRYAKIGAEINPRLPGLQLDLLGRSLLLLEALRAACRETRVRGVYRLNEMGFVERRPGRRKVEPYVPAEDSLGMLLVDFLPGELERRARRMRRERKLEIAVGLAIDETIRLTPLQILQAQIKAELLGIRRRHGDPLQYVARERPAFPEPHYNAEGEIDDRTPEYWKAVKARPGEEEVDMGTMNAETLLERVREEARKGAREGALDALAQHDAAQLMREIDEHLEEVDD